MQTQTLSQQALSVIQNYIELPIAGKKAQCPYFVNSRQRVRRSLRVLVGKGTPDEIVEEATIIALKEKTSLNSLDANEIKRFLVDHRIGSDCSGLVYHIIDAEYRARGLSSLSKHLAFPKAKGILRKIIAKFRPAENADTETFANQLNSAQINFIDAKPGDIVAILDSGINNDRDHILVVHKVDGEENKTVHYTHSFQWSTDGKYGHGVRQGMIILTDANKPLLEQKWIENGKINNENETYTHAKKARVCEMRRMQ